MSRPLKKENPYRDGKGSVDYANAGKLLYYVLRIADFFKLFD